MTDSGREVLKWVALILMTGDHVNKALLGGTSPWLTDAARVVFPIFAVVLAYGLWAHPDPRAARRAMRRLLFAGLIVQPFHAIAFGYWLPLNVLFSLALGIYVCSTPSLSRALAAWCLGGLLVDYLWTGPALMLAAVIWFRSGGSWRARVFASAAALALCLFNGNAWALLALPLLALFGQSGAVVPRWRWTFLGYYGTHLAVLALLV